MRHTRRYSHGLQRSDSAACKSRGKDGAGLRIVKFLVEQRGANLALRNADGEMAAEVALTKGNQHIHEYLTRKENEEFARREAITVTEAQLAEQTRAAEAAAQALMEELAAEEAAENARKQAKKKKAKAKSRRGPVCQDASRGVYRAAPAGVGGGAVKEEGRERRRMVGSEGEQ